MQTILGAGGAIGSGLARELISYTGAIRLVSRNPQRVNTGDELLAADLTNEAGVDTAVAGSDIVYLVAGLEYKTSVWQQQWPVIMQHVISACKKHGAKLVFFDNVYMYDRDYLMDMTERTPVHPTSEKGAVRAQIARMILDEIETGSLTAMIIRAADFIGPKNSVLADLVYKNLKGGKKAMWLADASKIHSFTFVPDAVRATAIAGNTPDAYNQIWHVPTDSTPLTGKQWIELFAKEMKVAPKYRVLPVWMMGLLGIFVPVMKEVKEMAYQYERDYFFNSSKFQKRFSVTAATPEESVRYIINTI